MEQHIVAQAVCGDGIVFVIVFICIPVLAKLFRAKNENVSVFAFVVFYYGKSREGFTQTNAIGKNTTVVLLQLIDNGKNCIALEVVKHIPYFALFESRSLIWKNIFGNIFKKLIENIVKSDEIDKFGRIFLVCNGYVIKHNVGYVLKTILITPKLLKKINIRLAERHIRFLNHAVCVVATLTPKINRSKPIDRHIVFIVHINKAHHIFVCNVGFESNLFANPISTLFCYRFLCKFITKFYFKFCAVQAALAVHTRNIEFTLFLGSVFGREGWRGENKTEFINVFKFLLQLLKGVDRETSCRYRHLAT